MDYTFSDSVKACFSYTVTGSPALACPSCQRHISVISSLLQGRFDYTDAGIGDKTHLRFFTLDSILKLFQKYTTIEKMAGTFGPVSAEEQQMLDTLEKIPNLAQKTEFQIYQYIFNAKKNL